MIIVSDTTPLHYLILIDEAELLPSLFDEIIVPSAVLQELSHERTPEKVFDWIQNRPAWVQIKSAPEDVVRKITGLGKGETEAIAIAIEENADAVLMDDKKAIREARVRGLTVITMFGILELASAKNFIDLAVTLDKISKTNFRLPSKEIIEEILSRDRSRKSDPH